MRYFWYISKSKIDSLAAQDQSAFERLRSALSILIKAEAKLPVASVGVELKANEPSASLVRQLDSVKKKLEAHTLVKTAEEASAGDVPLFFSFKGPSARIIRDGQFWTATIDGSTAVLLGGSAAHCIGGAVPQGPSLSPSINPMASISSLFDGKAEQGQEDRASSTWSRIVQDSSGGPADLPLGQGVAIYAARFDAVPWQMQRSGYKGKLNRILVGSPLYVEQVTG